MSALALALFLLLGGGCQSLAEKKLGDIVAGAVARGLEKHVVPRLERVRDESGTDLSNIARGAGLDPSKFDKNGNGKIDTPEEANALAVAVATKAIKDEFSARMKNPSKGTSFPWGEFASALIGLYFSAKGIGGINSFVRKKNGTVLPAPVPPPPPQ